MDYIERLAQRERAGITLTETLGDAIAQIDDAIAVALLDGHGEQANILRDGLRQMQAIQDDFEYECERAQHRLNREIG